jgi:hypothetical protein
MGQVNPILNPRNITPLRVTLIVTFFCNTPPRIFQNQILAQGRAIQGTIHRPLQLPQNPASYLRKTLRISKIRTPKPKTTKPLFLKISPQNNPKTLIM